MKPISCSVLAFVMLMSKSQAIELRIIQGLPKSQSTVGSYRPTSLIIRHDLPGKIVLLESTATFTVRLNIKVPDHINTSDIRTNYSMDLNSKCLILQVFKPNNPKPNPSKDQLVLIITITLSGLAIVCISVTMAMYFCWWKKRTNRARETTEDDAHNDVDSGAPITFAHKRQIFETGSHMSLHVTITVAIAMICVSHAQLVPSVDIVVEVPPGFLGADKVEIFVNEDNKNVVDTLKYHGRVNVYDVDSATAVQENRCASSNRTCVRGACDPLTGKCVCPRDKKPVRVNQWETTCINKCTGRCPKATYEERPCNATHEAICKKCRPPCNFEEFESTSCSGKTDRNCTSISKLPDIKVSSNMIYEDLTKIDHDVKVSQLISNFSAQYTVWLNRSSGIALRAVIKESDFSTTLRQVTHDNNNDNERYPPIKDFKAIQNKFCKSPLPDSYRITLKKFQELKVLQNDNSKPCPNYENKSSKNSKPAAKEKGLYCNDVNSSILRLFGTRNSSTASWNVERSRYCYTMKKRCSKCRDKCSNNIDKYPNCQLSQANGDMQTYGEHFSYCFDCCFKSCTCAHCACGKYQKECVRGQLKCININEYQLNLDSVFPTGGNFKCHVEMSRGPEVVVETSLWRFGQRIHSVSSVDNTITNADRKTFRDLGYMTVTHPTLLQSMMGNNILISGNTNDNTFSVGTYKHETDVTNTIATGPTKSEIHIQPRYPFGLNSKKWNKRDCNVDINQTSGFAIVQNSKSHTNFERLENLTAILGKARNGETVYKVYNNKQSHRLNFGLPRDRSVLRHIFPKTTIVDDVSLVGVLLRNRTFWTLRFSGRLFECPGAFNVKVYDQDMPSVEVYNYDIAVTGRSKCEFQVEFHLPSGGDTDLIDKQFLTTLRDSYKTIKITLVSPRYKPNFELPVIKSHPNLDQLLQLLQPIFYALGCALVLFLLLLIYAYQTRPKDRFQRDRDNALHFRHILFVIWYVGVRLIKSFLLTLTLFSIIFSAVHHRDVNTLKRYGEFTQLRKNVDDAFLSQMDKHKIDELNRQHRLLIDGKISCDRKLKHVDELMDTYYAEMRKQLFGDIKEKSVINAAFQNIKKKAKEAKRNFELKRQNVNRELKYLANEMNNIIHNMRLKVERNFWLKAAKVFHGLAKAFGNPGPFINWVGLDASFPSLDVNLQSFDSVFDKFLHNFDTTSFELNPALFSKIKVNMPNVDLKLNLQEVSIPPINFSTPISSKRAKELLFLDLLVQRSGILAGILLIIDILLFLYCHCKTYQSAAKLLHGFPVVHDLDKLKKVKKKKEKKIENKNDNKYRVLQSGYSHYQSVESFDSFVSTSSTTEQKSLQDIASLKLNAGKFQSATKTCVENGNRKFNSQDIDKTSIEDDTYYNEPLNKNETDTTQKNTRILTLQTNSENHYPLSRGGSLDSLHAEEVEIKRYSNKLTRYCMTMLSYASAGVFVAFRLLKRLNHKLTKTNLVPMASLGVTAALLIYIIIITAKYSFTVDTLDIIGYFDVKMAPILVTRKIVNTRITASAFMINQVQIPYYQKRVNARIAFAKKQAKLFKIFQCTTADLHNTEYCSWTNGKCDGLQSYTDEILKNLSSLECHISPVIPQRFTKFDRITYKEQLKKGIHPFISAVRGLVLNTFYTIIVLVGIVALLQMLGILVFFALKRFDLIRTVKTYSLSEELKTDCPDGDERGDWPKKQPIKVGRIKVPETITKQCGPVRVRPGWHLEFRPEEAKKLQKKKKNEKRQISNEKRNGKKIGVNSV